MWRVAGWLRTESNDDTSDDDVMVDARIAVTVSIGYISSVFKLDPDKAAEYLTENPNQVVHVMQMATTAIQV